MTAPAGTFGQKSAGAGPGLPTFKPSYKLPERGQGVQGLP